MAYEIRDAAFEKWLEEEHPFHDEYDHANLATYERWQKELRTAFNAGWSGRKAAQYGLLRVNKKVAGRTP